jgi:CheY-like chemotaxis protein
MPGMDGFELLQWLKEHPECGIIPVIVFSSSRREADVRKAYQLGANAYIMKPRKLVELVDVLHSTYEFWSHCERPAIPKRC